MRARAGFCLLVALLVGACLPGAATVERLPEVDSLNAWRTGNVIRVAVVGSAPEGGWQDVRLRGDGVFLRGTGTLRLQLVGTPPPPGSAPGVAETYVVAPTSYVVDLDRFLGVEVIAAGNRIYQRVY